MEGNNVTGEESGKEKSDPLTDEFKFDDWTVNCKCSHILPSKCLPSCSESQPCVYCSFTKQLELPHLPEMVYPNNFLSLSHKNGYKIIFDALGALKAVKAHENSTLTIAVSEEWKNSRKETGLVEKTIGSFDWTFSSDYGGHLENWGELRQSDIRIDLDRLRQKEEILLYKSITLFEDELHDNGISLSSVRIRVMPTCFFILLRHFLRVDRVILSVHDTRYFHDFTTDYIIRETSSREGRVSDLKLPISIMNDPDEVTPRLPLKSLKNEHLIIADKS